MMIKKFLTPLFKGLVCMLVFLMSVQCNKKKEQKPVEEKKEVAVETSLRTVNDTELAEFIVNEKPVIVLFEQDSCGACPSVKAVLEEIVAETGDKYVVATIDASANPATVANYKVEATPTVIIFKNGEEIARFSGSVEKAAVIEKLDSVN